MAKPHLVKKAFCCNHWPGAMEFEVWIGPKFYWLCVDSWGKVRWYLERLALDPNYPCGVDFG